MGSEENPKDDRVELCGREFRVVQIGDLLPKRNVQIRITMEEWEARGRGLFGPDQMKWAFVCPVCEHVATVKDYQDAGAPEGAVGFSCVGRWLASCRDAFRETGPGPCNYAGAGLIGLNPVRVTTSTGTIDVFDFADPNLERNPDAQRKPGEPADKEATPDA